MRENETLSQEQIDRVYKQIQLKVRCMTRSSSTTSEVDDLTQDAMTRVVMGLPSFDPDRGALTTFIDRVTHSSVIDSWRKQSAQKRGRFRTLSLDAMAEDAESSVDDLTWQLGAGGPLSTPTDRQPAGDGAELKQDIAATLENLPDSTRKLCQMVMRIGVSQTASELGVARGTIRRRLKKLRRLFEDAGMKNYLEK